MGDRAPDIKPGKWLTAAPDMGGSPVFIEFFHSTNKHSAARLGELDRLARQNGDLVVVVVTREQSPDVISTLTDGNPAYYPMIDSANQTFSAYKVQFVPYSVLSDRKGRIVWLGNPTTLSNDEIIKLLK